MTELVSSNNNYSCYRKAFNECQGFKIPILGVHLKDLIAVHVIFPDWVHDSSQVNLVKMHQLYMTFNELVSLQSAVAQVEPNMDLIYLLTVRDCFILCIYILYLPITIKTTVERAGRDVMFNHVMDVDWTWDSNKSSQNWKMVQCCDAVT